MVLCTSVYLAEKKSFAFLDSVFLETDGCSDAILKQLEPGSVHWDGDGEEEGGGPPGAEHDTSPNRDSPILTPICRITKFH